MKFNHIETLLIFIMICAGIFVVTTFLWPAKPKFEAVSISQVERDAAARKVAASEAAYQDAIARKAAARKAAAKEAAAAKEKADLEKLSQWMNDGISKGIFSHVDEQRCTVRMDLLVWISLSLEAKRGLLRGCATYFKIRTGLYDATILSNRNDTKLADYSFLRAERIHY